MFDRITYFKERGRHSNIPECCIEFFCYKWNVGGWTKKQREERWARVHAAGPYRYMPCDDCLQLGKASQVHFCNEECKGSHDVRC